jgi:hypothetical protein
MMQTASRVIGSDMGLSQGMGFVLIVDEEVLVRGIDLDILQRIGYTVIMANSG